MLTQELNGVEQWDNSHCVAHHVYSLHVKSGVLMSHCFIGMERLVSSEIA